MFLPTVVYTVLYSSRTNVRKHGSATKLDQIGRTQTKMDISIGETSLKVNEVLKTRGRIWAGQLRTIQIHHIDHTNERGLIGSRPFPTAFRRFS